MPERSATSRDMIPPAAVVIVAAGRGERFGAADKVFAPLRGRPLLAYALDAAEQSAARDIVLVVGEHTRAAAAALVACGEWPKVRAVVTGGARRQDSVAAGVRAVAPDIAVVAVHDGARPLAKPALFDACLAAAAESGAAIAAIPVADTLKRVAGDEIVATVPRDGLWAAQTPQAFRRDLLVHALASPEAGNGTFTDEAALCEALGLSVRVVPGSRANLKVTRPDDLAIAAALLAQLSGCDVR